MIPPRSEPRCTRKASFSWLFWVPEPDAWAMTHRHPGWTASSGPKNAWRPPVGARAQVGCVGQEGVFRRGSGLGGGSFSLRNDKRHAGWPPIVPVWRYTMRATDGFQTTITLGPVKDQGQVVS